MRTRLDKREKENTLLGARIDPIAEHGTSRADATNGNPPETAPPRDGTQDRHNIQTTDENEFRRTQTNTYRRRITTTSIWLIFIAIDACAIWYIRGQTKLTPTFTVNTPWGTADILTPWGRENSPKTIEPKQEWHYTKKSPDQIPQQPIERTKNQIYKCIENGKITFTDTPCK
jgi:hypothetical protein